MRMKKTKILAVSIGLLIIAGLSLAPSVTASQVDITPRERIETWLNNNTELSNAEKTEFIELILVFIEWMRILFGEDIGLMLGMLMVAVFCFVPFLGIASVLGVPAVVNAIDLVLEEMEFDWEQFLSAVGVIGTLVFIVLFLPLVLIVGTLIYPLCAVGVFFGLYAELYWYIAEAFL